MKIILLALPHAVGLAVLPFGRKQRIKNRKILLDAKGWVWYSIARAVLKKGGQNAPCKPASKHLFTNLWGRFLALCGESPAFDLVFIKRRPALRGAGARRTARSKAELAGITLAAGKTPDYKWKRPVPFRGGTPRILVSREWSGQGRLYSAFYLCAAAFFAARCINKKPTGRSRALLAKINNTVVESRTSILFPAKLPGLPQSRPYRPAQF